MDQRQHRTSVEALDAGALSVLTAAILDGLREGDLVLMKFANTSVNLGKHEARVLAERLMLKGVKP